MYNTHARWRRLDSSWRSEQFANKVASEITRATFERPKDQDEVDERDERLEDLLGYFYYSVLDIARGKYTDEETRNIYKSLSDASDALAERGASDLHGALFTLAQIVNLSSDVPSSSEERYRWVERFRDWTSELGLYG